MSRSQLNLRLDSELLQKLKDESKASGVPQAELVRRMLVERFGGAEGRAVEYDGEPQDVTWKEPPPVSAEVVERQVAEANPMLRPLPPRGFRCPLPACRHQQKGPGKCPVHRAHDLVPVRL